MAKGKILACALATLMAPAAFGLPVLTAQDLGAGKGDSARGNLVQDAVYRGGDNLPIQNLNDTDNGQLQLFHLVSDSEAWPHGEPVEDPEVRPTAGDIWRGFKIFDLIVLVDKASDVQTVRAFKVVNGKIVDILNGNAPLVVTDSNQTDPVDEVMGSITPLKKMTRVSTGTERYGCGKKVDKQTGQISAIKYFGQTPTGYYIPTSLEIDHWSGKYEDGHMAYSVFFVPQLGIATHTHSGGGLGRRASHGCVRMAEKTASTLFREVMLTGGPVNPDSPFLKAQCNPDVGCDASQSLMRTNNKKYSAFVTSALAEGQKIGRPYSQMQMVPVIRRNGTFVKDTKNPAQAKMQAGYKTLYIIENTHPWLDPQIPGYFSCPSDDQIARGDYTPYQSDDDGSMRPPLDIGNGSRYNNDGYYNNGGYYQQQQRPSWNNGPQLTNPFEELGNAIGNFFNGGR